MTNPRLAFRMRSRGSRRVNAASSSDVVSSPSRLVSIRWNNACVTDGYCAHFLETQEIVAIRILKRSLRAI